MYFYLRDGGSTNHELPIPLPTNNAAKYRNFESKEDTRIFFQNWYGFTHPLRGKGILQGLPV
jgi:hypothetical protein